MFDESLLSGVAGQLIGQPMFGLLQQAQALERTGKKLIHLELGDPDFNAPAHIIDAVQRAMREGHTHYVDPMGIIEFRQAIAESTSKQLGVDLSYQQVVVTPGANSGIYWTMRCLLEAGDEVLLPDPGFPSFHAAAKAASARVITYHLDESDNYRPNLDHIERSISSKTKLMIVNSPSNPTGSILERKDLDALYRLAKQYNLIVLSDETYRNIVFREDSADSIAVNDGCSERCVILSGLSKEFSISGLRLGYLIGPEVFIKKIGLYIESVVSCVPPFIQKGGVAALKGSQEIIKNHVDEMRFRRDYLVKRLNEIDGVNCLLPDGGLYAFPNVSGTGMDGYEFSERMMSQAGVIVVPGGAFGLFGKYHVRLSLNNNVESIERAVRSISSCL